MTFEELGQSIREKREAAGMSIDDVASRIKISARILRTIEEGSLVGLPHAVYTKSFIRSFGQLIGYNPQELSAALEDLFPPDAFDESKAESLLRANPAMSYPDAGKRFAIMLFLLFFLVGLIGGAGYVAVRYGEQILEAIKAPFSALTSPSEGPREQHTAVPPAETSDISSRLPNMLPVPAGQPSFAKDQVPATRIASPPGNVSAASASNATTDSPASAGVGAFGPENVQMPVSTGNRTGVVFANSSGISRQTSIEETVLAEIASPGGKNTLIVRANAECWIRSRADSERTREYTIQTGANFTITYDQRLEITFGNAGGVSVSHNGKNLGTPGARGQIVIMRFPERE